ncbi:dihydrolipoamide acetyltransferase family protein [Actinomadura sp. B10D3]|uniref:dihydrolipoamide acetyltransferase family protein n=1 Tax=Actinomadura sp. B10D3 TaxID=3153557 RepID=UPI00325ED6B8
MRRTFMMPDPGEGLAEAEIISWHVAVGEPVAEDQDLVSVETAKAVVVLPCPSDGVLVERHGETGDTVSVGDLLAVFEEAAPAGEAPVAEPPAAVPVHAEPAETASSATTEGADPRPGRPTASPAVRRRARELGVDLATVRGSGPAGRILASDLDRWPPERSGTRPEGSAADTPASPEPSSPTAETIETPLRGLRRTIGRTMSAGWQTIPHMFDLREADASGLLAGRNALRERARRAGDDDLAQALTPLALLVKIAAVALARTPEIHGYVDEDRQVIVHHRRCHLGIAVATPDGLLTPVLADVDRRPLADLAKELRGLGEAARSRTLTPRQMSGATFLVNNLGPLGTHFGTPLIPPGLGGNLGFGRIVERPVVRDGKIAAAPVLPLSISADHRLVDGDVLAAFAGTVAELVENPVLLLEGLR